MPVFSKRDGENVENYRPVKTFFGFYQKFMKKVYYQMYVY